MILKLKILYSELGGISLQVKGSRLQLFALVHGTRNNSFSISIKFSKQISAAITRYNGRQQRVAVAWAWAGDREYISVSFTAGKSPGGGNAFRILLQKFKYRILAEINMLAVIILTLNYM